MATITAVAITYGRTFNLGDYQSARIDITIEADLDELDDRQAVLDDLWRRAKDNVKAQALPLYRKQADQVREVFGGLPPDLQQELIAAFMAAQEA